MRIRVTRGTTVADDYLTIVGDLHHHLSLPKIKRLWLPPLRDQPDRSAEFGAIVLEDDSVGLMFVLLDDTLHQINDRFDPKSLVGTDPAELAMEFQDRDPARKALALGAINAIGQHVIRASQLPLDTETNSIAAFDPRPEDRIGMVGFFPPLVERLRAARMDLTVIELKSELIQQEDRFQVTLDPAALKRCNKILCTSTVLLNDSVDRMLEYCTHADQLAIIGPSAGFLPDPLFDRNVDTVGGNQIVDATGFITHCEDEEKWGQTARKYCLHHHDYPGYQALLRRLR